MDSIGTNVEVVGDNVREAGTPGIDGINAIPGEFVRRDGYVLAL